MKRDPLDIAGQVEPTPTSEPPVCVSAGTGQDVIRTRPLVPQQAADQLPSDARERLVRASQIHEPLARRMAIDEATAYARIRYPQLFQPATAS